MLAHTPSRGIFFQALADGMLMAKQHSQETKRYSFDYLNLFGFCVIVGQEYAVMLHRF